MKENIVMVVDKGLDINNVICMIKLNILHIPNLCSIPGITSIEILTALVVDFSIWGPTVVK
jgi:hypothetical protein